MIGSARLARTNVARCAKLLFAGMSMAVLAASCAAPTEMTLHITTNVACTIVEEQGISVAAGDPSTIRDRSPAMQTTRCTAGTTAVNEIGHLVIVPNGAKDADVALRIVAGVDVPVASCSTETNYQGCIVSRFLLPFVEHQNLNLDVRLSASCKGVPCDDLTTCQDGTCVSARVDLGSCEGSSACAPNGPSFDASVDAGPQASADGAGDGRTASTDAASDASTDGAGDASTDGATDSVDLPCPPTFQPPLNNPDAICQRPSQTCCQVFAGGECAGPGGLLEAGVCSGGYTYTCSRASHCSGATPVCCADANNLATCLSAQDCALAHGVQLCAATNECATGTCAPITCTTSSVRATTVTFSTCSATCPM